MDEGMFEWNGDMTPVRWVRYLDIGKQGSEDMEILYTDLYIIGRHHQSDNRKDIRVQVNIEAKGRKNSPSSLQISFGFRGMGGRVMYEDKEFNIKIIMGDTGWTSAQEVEDIIKKDPNYSFLFDEQITRERLVDLLEQKIDMVSRDWDKKNAVFESNNIEGKKETEKLS